MTTAVNSELTDAFNEFHRERIEAIAIFERCLNEGTAEHLERWLEARIIRESHAYPLLLDLQESLSHRLLSLRRFQIDSEPASSADLENRIALVAHLHDFVKDWLQAITLKSLRHFWNQSISDQPQ
jgi:hypothetical protein